MNKQRITLKLVPVGWMCRHCWMEGTMEFTKDVMLNKTLADIRIMVQNKHALYSERCNKPDVVIVPTVQGK